MLMTSQGAHSSRCCLSHTDYFQPSGSKTSRACVRHRPRPLEALAALHRTPAGACPSAMGDLLWLFSDFVLGPMVGNVLRRSCIYCHLTFSSSSS